MESATRITERGLPSAVVQEVLEQSAAEKAGEIFRALKQLAHELAETLQSTVQALRLAESNPEQDLASAIQEMPRLDLYHLNIDVTPGFLWKVSRNLSIRRAENELRDQIGQRVSEAFASFGSMLDAWSRRTLSELQIRFEGEADAYRAHIGRVTVRGQVSTNEESAIARDLALLTESASEMAQVL
jgi:hypothetical protein